VKLDTLQDGVVAAYILQDVIYASSTPCATASGHRIRLIERPLRAHPTTPFPEVCALSTRESLHLPQCGY